MAASLGLQISRIFLGWKKRKTQTSVHQKMKKFHRNLQNTLRLHDMDIKVCHVVSFDETHIEQPQT